MSTGTEKAGIVGTAATLASLIFPVIPQIGPLPIRLLICLAIGSVATFAIVNSQSTALTNILSEYAHFVMSIARRIFRLFCQGIHFLAIGLANLDCFLSKLNSKSSRGDRAL